MKQRGSSKKEGINEKAAAGPKILLIDESAFNMAYLERTLSEVGFSVSCTTPDDGALEVAIAKQPEVIVTDVVCHKDDGYGFFRAVAAHPVLAHIPLILLSAPTNEVKEIQDASGAPTVLIGKPPNFDEVKDAVEQFVGKIAHTDGISDVSILAGNIADFGLPLILQLISSSRKSIQMTLETNSGQGMLRFSDGNLISAWWGERTGHAAALSLMALTEGWFSCFRADVQSDAEVLLSFDAIPGADPRFASDQRLKPVTQDLQMQLTNEEQATLDRFLQERTEMETVVRTSSDRNGDMPISDSGTFREDSLELLLKEAVKDAIPQNKRR